MARDNGMGMFEMGFITDVAKMSLNEGKLAVIKKIDASTASAANKEKGRRLVDQSRTLNQLIIGMSNFSLAHQGLAKL